MKFLLGSPGTDSVAKISLKRPDTERMQPLRLAS
jgi:hypothetical protein